MDGRHRQVINPPAVTSEVEEVRISPIKSFAGFRVGASKRVKRLSLKTPLHPDHTYNGVSFNINVKKDSTNWVFVTGFEASGLLGVMTVFALWGRNVNDHARDRHLWKKIHQKEYDVAWEKFQVLALDEPIRIGPGETCGFYIHSDCCENDLGLKYRSCVPGVVLQDDNVEVSHGWAHTHFIPFDEVRGWFRKNRVLSGNIFYEATPLRWSPDRNFFWTKNTWFQNALDCVMTVKCFPPGVRLEIMTFCDMDWFNFNKSISSTYTQEMDNRCKLFERSNGLVGRRSRSPDVLSFSIRKRARREYFDWDSSEEKSSYESIGSEDWSD